jgi:endonuclease-3
MRPKGDRLDTHVWAWVFDRNPQLGAGDPLAGGGRFHVGPVSFYEIANIVRLGTWPETARHAADLEVWPPRRKIRIAPLAAAICLHAAARDWPHRDPFDRLIASTAELLGLPMVTRDPVFDTLRQVATTWSGAILRPMLDAADRQELMRRIGDALPDAQAPEIKTGRDPFRSVVSCMLSAQSLDRNTAAASAALFALADTPEGILALPEARIAAAIRPCGLYNVKARNLRRMCTALLEEHGGRVPTTRAGLMSLPGVGRKCADIVLHFTFGEAVVAVDTHVHRVCNRTGLAEGKTEERTARALEARLPAGWEMRAHVLLLAFGKRTCRARTPRCPDCPVTDLCKARREGRVGGARRRP